jgi:DNA-binding transcriptional LysR family regulator
MMREIQHLGDGRRGAALVGASMSLGSYRLPPVITTFRRTRPEVELTLVIGDPESSLHGVEQGELDFCVVVLDTPPDGSVLEAEILGEEPVVLVASPEGEPLDAEICLAELASAPMVGSPSGSMRRTVIDRALGRLNAPRYKSVIDLGHPEAIKRAVLEGAGAALLFKSAVAAELRSGALRQVRIRDAELNIPIYAFKRRDKRLSTLQAQLLAEMRHALTPNRNPAAESPNGRSELDH